MESFAAVEGVVFGVGGEGADILSGGVLSVRRASPASPPSSGDGEDLLYGPSSVSPASTKDDFISSEAGNDFLAGGSEFVDDWIGLRRLHGAASGSSFGMQMTGGV